MIKHLVNFGASEVVGANIPHDQVRVRAIRDNSLSGLLERFGDGSGVGDHLPAVLAELGRSHLSQLNGKSANLVVVRPALKHGEHCEVDSLQEFFLAEDDSRAGASEALVSGRRDNVTELERVVHLLSGDQSADVRNVSHKERSNAVGDLPVPRVVKVSGIATGSAQQNFRLEFCDGSLECIHVDHTRLLIDKIGLGNEVVTACRYLFRLSLMTVGQVTTVS